MKFDKLVKNRGAKTLEQVALDHGTIVRDIVIPGRFYSLRVEAPVPDLNEAAVNELNYGRGYYDLNPVGLVFYHPNWVESGSIIMLDLRIIPTRISSKILEGYYRAAMQTGLESLWNQNGELKPISERRGLDLPFYSATPSQLAYTIGASGLYFAINTYNRDQIREARLIDWDSFGMLIEPKISQYGLFPTPFNMEEVYSRFIENTL